MARKIPLIRNLSAIGSNSAPPGVELPVARASQPSIASVQAAARNSTSARVRRPSTMSRMITGVNTTRASVKRLGTVSQRGTEDEYIGGRASPPHGRGKPTDMPRPWEDVLYAIAD